MVDRVFEDVPAVRAEVPVFVGVVGPSGTGKTFSAMRIATGMQRVTGGDIHVIDTESRRALHYADRFKFRHVPFAAPFSPDDYLAAMRHSVSRGARVIVVDSMSHEHEGDGGVLEWHARNVERMCKGDEGRRDKVAMAAWIEPKAARRRLINGLLQLPANFVFCFRAKEKIKPVRGKDPEQLGWMPIAGDEFVFELTVSALLLPGANGVPEWRPANAGERAMVKRPAQFDALLERFEGKQLCEEIGEAMATWAKGDVQERKEVQDLRRVIAEARTLADLEEPRRIMRTVKETKALTPAEYRDIAPMLTARIEELTPAASPASINGGSNAQ